MGDGRQAFAAIVEKIGVSEVSAAPYPAPQLVKLRQSELVRLINNHSVGVGHIQSRLDNSGADEDIHLPLRESGHYFFQLVFPHLDVTSTAHFLRTHFPTARGT